MKEIKLTTRRTPAPSRRASAVPPASDPRLDLRLLIELALISNRAPLTT